MPTMTNRTFDEIAVGDRAAITREVTAADVALFAAVSGDVNPAHLDAAWAATTRFGGVIMHGMWSGAIVSTLLGVHLPGPGTIYLSQSLAFRRPVKLGDRVTFSVTVTEKRDDRKIVVLACAGVNGDGKTVVEGEAVVMAPTEKLSLPTPDEPAVTIALDGAVVPFRRK